MNYCQLHSDSDCHLCDGRYDDGCECEWCAMKRRFRAREAEMRREFKLDSLLPGGCTEKDTYFDVPDAEGASKGARTVTPPKTTMVWCADCQRYWEAPATADYWKARAETCPECKTEKEAA